MQEKSHTVNQPTKAGETFAGLGLKPKLLEVLTGLGFTTPTPIQHKAIPVAVEGKDIIGIAQTGTGKTLALGLPMIQRLSEMPGKQGLIIAPTRELALQIDEVLQKIGRSFGLKTAVLIGGTGMGMQMHHLSNKPHIIIGTPGRMNDHIERRTLHLKNVAILVLDEADHMFDMGFAPQIKKIIALLPTDRQTMLFSATMPADILKMATAHMKLPLRFEIAPQGTTAERVEHELFVVPREQRVSLLKNVLDSHTGNVIVFMRTKHNASKLCRQINAQNISATEIHSNRSLNQRKTALEGFKQGRFRVLVATDIAARGIDVKGVGLVINYDLPESPSDYVHRIGRTGRAGMAGKAISFALPDQRNKVKEIERLIRYVIPVSQLPEGLPTMNVPRPVKDGSDRLSHKRNFHGKRNFGRPHRRRY